MSSGAPDGASDAPDDARGNPSGDVSPGSARAVAPGDPTDSGA